MLPSISVALCLQLYVINTIQYREACNKGVEAALVSSQMGKDLEQARIKLEEIAKNKINPTAAAIPLIAHQTFVKKQINYKLPHSGFEINANHNGGSAFYTWRLK